jgi:hypothetical protein
MNEGALTGKDIEGSDSAPRLVMRDGTLSMGARMTFLFLNSFDWAIRGCLISNGRLARYLGCKRRAVQNYLKELRKRNLIRDERSDTPTHRKITILVNDPKNKNRKEMSYAKACITPSNEIHPLTQENASYYAQFCTQGIGREIEKDIKKGNSITPQLRNNKKYPPIVEAIKMEGSEDVRDAFFDDYARWMRYYNSAQPSVEQMIQKIKQSLCY